MTVIDVLFYFIGLSQFEICSLSRMQPIKRLACIAWEMQNHTCHHTSCTETLVRRQSHLDAPDPSPAADTKPIAALASQRALRRPAHVADFVIAPPASARSLTLDLTRYRRCTTVHGCSTACVEEIPDQHHGIVGTTGQHASAARTPFDRVQRG